MEKLKILVRDCPAVRALNYAVDNEVILAVDSSWMAVGYILSQVGDDKRRYPSRFGSITWNEREQRYSQAKIELYGLFRALKSVKLFIVGVRNLTVEVDAKYIKGMINNPDIQPSAAMNRWIAGILLFGFKLRHVPGKDHAPADGLSRRPRAPKDMDDDDDIDDWIDQSYSFAVSVMNWEATLIQKHEAHLYAQGTYESGKPEFRRAHPYSILSVLTVVETHLKIPRNEISEKRDQEIKDVQKFLKDPSQIPSGLTEREIQRFVKRASKFFVTGSQLWRKHAQGRNQLVIPEDRRLGLLGQAHDDLGHKGIFSVRSRLLDRFYGVQSVQKLKRDIILGKFTRLAIISGKVRQNEVRKNVAEM